VRVRGGQIVWVDLDPTRGHEQRGHRPALVIAAAAMRSTTIVVPLTSSPPKAPSHHRMAGERMSVALCEQVRAIDTERVTGVLGAAELADLDRVRKIVAMLIGVQATRH